MRAIGENKKNYQLLVKHNKLIQSKYSLNANEQKLLYKIFEEVQKRGYKTREIKLTFQDFYREYKNIIGRNISKSDFKYVIESIQDKKPYIIDMENDTYIRTQWYAIKGKLDLSEVTLVIDEMVFEYIQSLDRNFTGLKIDTLYSFKNFYSMRVYELLKQWSSTRDVIIYKVDELKKLLGLELTEQVEKDGTITILNSGYKNFNTFEKRILKKAVDEINEKSELLVSYETKKKGRKVDEVIFTIVEKNGCNLLVDKDKKASKNPKESKEDVASDESDEVLVEKAKKVKKEAIVKNPNDKSIEAAEISETMKASKIAKNDEDDIFYDLDKLNKLDEVSAKKMYNIPVPLNIEKDLYFMFHKEFGSVDFEDMELLFILIQAQKYTLDKDVADCINVNNYSLFRSSLKGRLDKIYAEREEREIEKMLTPEELEQWYVIFHKMPIKEYYKMIRDIEQSPY